MDILLCKKHLIDAPLKAPRELVLIPKKRAALDAAKWHYLMY
jgi:hypothetical protein